MDEPNHAVTLADWPFGLRERLLTSIARPAKEERMVLDQSHNNDDTHGPEDTLILAPTCPWCGTKLRSDRQLSSDREPGREVDSCPSCGVSVRLDRVPAST